MTCRADVKKLIYDDIYNEFAKNRYTIVRVNDNTFRIANQQSTKGKSRAEHLRQATLIANEIKSRVYGKYGNNVDVNIEVPYYIGFPVEMTIEPLPEYIETVYAQVKPEKRTEFLTDLAFTFDPALYQQELMEDSPLKMIPYEVYEAQEKARLKEETERKAREEALKRITIDEKGQYRMFQEAGTAEALSVLSTNSELAKDLQRTTDYTLLTDQEESDVLNKKSGQAYVFLKEKDAERLSFLLEKHKEYPKEFTVTQRVEKFERTKGKGLSFKSYNEYRDFVYLKTNKNKKSNLYNIVDKATGELVAEKVRIVHLVKDAKETIAAKYGLEFTPTQIFSADRSIAFALYRQKPSKAKYIAQSKRYLYDALKFLNPEETSLKINLDRVEELLNAFPSGMWDYINTTYSPEDSTNINASISLQNEIKFNLPKLGLLTEIEKITGKKLQGVSFTNYDRSGGIEKVLGVKWRDSVVIDYKSMTTKQLRKAIAYYLNSTGYFKSTSEEENVRKYAEHNNIDYNELQKLVFGDFDQALENIAYNQTGNSDTIELSKWRESIRNYDWQTVELFSKPYENFYKRAKEKVKEKFKDKELSNGISHLDYFFSGNFNWLNINFNNISGQYYESDMETQAYVGVEEKVVGWANPFVMKIYKKPTPVKNFLKEQEVFNRLASILHEPFHALHALSYGTKEELALRRAFDNLYNTAFGKEMMNQVFGSGYRGEEVSYDVLYKEFTAFATQLMLFPKEWITKTDLRSNDIYEFIEKVQTLQDKTYEEIVRTQQKIGTTEKVVTEQEKIKLNFLEKLYNFVVSALNKVVPLSKKFFKNIADSRLIEKTVIEDVFGEVEEKVTRVVKLPKEVKESKEEFLSKMDDLKSAILTLMQIDETMFSSRNINNFFTKPSFYQESGTIKPGVEELFESNPELADEVYEALGFEERKTYKGNITDLKSNQVFVFGSNLQGLHGRGAAGAAFGKQQSVSEISSVPDGTKGKWAIKGVGEGMMKGIEGKSYGFPTVVTPGAQKSRTDNEIIESVKKLYDTAIANPTLEFLIAYSNVPGLAGYTPQELAKFFSSHNIPQNIIFEEGFNKLIEITPQQKQQALQQYSDYLDTIFPDSQVKDIVYHLSNAEFEKFDKKFISTNTRDFDSWLGFFFTTDKTKFKELLKSRNLEWKQEYPAILNIKKIANEPGILSTKFKDVQGLTEKSEAYRNYKKSLLANNNDGIISLSITGAENITVFEPEQIHILGNQEDIERFKEFVEQTSATQTEDLSVSLLPTIETEEKKLLDIPDIAVETEFQQKHCK